MRGIIEELYQMPCPRLALAAGVARMEVRTVSAYHQPKRGLHMTRLTSESDERERLKAASIDRAEVEGSVGIARVVCHEEDIHRIITELASDGYSPVPPRRPATTSPGIWECFDDEHDPGETPFDEPVSMVFARGLPVDSSDAVERRSECTRRTLEVEVKSLEAVPEVVAALEKEGWICKPNDGSGDLDLRVSWAWLDGDRPTLTLIFERDFGEERRVNAARRNAETPETPKGPGRG